jgi:hypothetical protein
MTTTRTDWQEASAAEAQERLTIVSACPQTRHPSRVRWPVLLGWGGVLLGGMALWGLAALGLGRLTAWW